MVESGSWWLRIENLEALALSMADNGYSAHDVAHMVEKPWKFTEEYRDMIAEQEGAKA